jgi:ribosome-binding factor A
VSFRERRGPRFPPRVVVRSDDEVDPGLFFGERSEARKRNWKVEQLCKQVERAVAVTLFECEEHEVAGASVADVEPAPDARRLRVTVVLAPGYGIDNLDRARGALGRAAAAFRGEVARAIHRKRVPEIVFDVRLAAEVGRE